MVFIVAHLLKYRCVVFQQVLINWFNYDLQITVRIKKEKRKNDIVLLLWYLPNENDTDVTGFIRKSEAFSSV